MNEDVRLYVAYLVGFFPGVLEGWLALFCAIGMALWLALRNDDNRGRLRG